MAMVTVYRYAVWDQAAAPKCPSDEWGHAKQSARLREQ
jgi:hypothetical protein